MANETTQANQTEMNIVSIGGRLKATREALGLTRKDVAAQLRLSESVITMMEENLYPSDLPSTFIRGYLRSYGKLINIPEDEIQAAVEPIKPAAPPVDLELSPKPIAPITSSNYFMQISTYLIVATVFSLAGIWWYNHGTTPATTASLAPAITENATQAENQVKTLPLPGISSNIDENVDLSSDNLAQSLNTDPQLQPPALLAASDANQQPIIAAPSPTATAPTTTAETKPEVTPEEQHKVVAVNRPHAPVNRHHDDDDDEADDHVQVKRNPGF